MPSKCTKCGNADNYNFALNIGLCNSCISEELGRIGELESKLKNIYEQEQCNDCSAKTELPDKLIGCKAKKRNVELEAEITRLRNIMDARA